MGPDTFFLPDVAMGLCYTATSGAVKQMKILEYRYEPQEPQYHYHDDDHHYDDDQVIGTHQVASAKPSGETAAGENAPLEEPRQQQQDHKNQDDDHKYRYEPSPHVLTSLVISPCSSNIRQREQGQEDNRQDDHPYGELLFILPHPAPCLSVTC